MAFQSRAPVWEKKSFRFVWKSYKGADGIELSVVKEEPSNFSVRNWSNTGVGGITHSIPLGSLCNYPIRTPKPYSNYSGPYIT